MDTGITAVGVIAGALALFLVNAAVFTLVRPARLRRRNEAGGLSRMDLYALQRARKNDAMRQMRTIAREHRTPPTRHRDRREWPS